MRTLRKLLLAETWLLPGGVAVLLLVGALARHLVPATWERAGGFVLLAGVLGLCVASVSRSTRA